MTEETRPYFDRGSRQLRRGQLWNSADRRRLRRRRRRLLRRPRFHHRSTTFWRDV